MQKSSPRLIVALDFPTLYAANKLLDELDPKKCRVKIGKELFTRFGPKFVKDVIARGYEVFLDLKFHDIPHTVAQACLAAADLGVWMINVHALGGEKMLAAAREAIDSRSTNRPLLIAVTILTSMDDIELSKIGLTAPLSTYVLNLAKLAKNTGLDGVVCSAQEAQMLRQHCGANFCLVTPGIRLTQTSDDQVRVTTPLDAINNGVDYLVIGRPITKAEQPLKVVHEIENILLKNKTI